MAIFEFDLNLGHFSMKDTIVILNFVKKRSFVKDIISEYFGCRHFFIKDVMANIDFYLN